MAIGIFYQWPHSFDYRRSADRQPLKETQTNTHTTIDSGYWEIEYTPLANQNFNALARNWQFGVYGTQCQCLWLN